MKRLPLKLQLTTFSKEQLSLLVLRAEKYFAKSSVDLSKTYKILDDEDDISKPNGPKQSILRYIPGDPQDTFDIVLN